MIKSTYKPGEDIISTNNKNKNRYSQYYWNGELWYKGLWYKGIRYQECYIWDNKGIKYII
jgi:hypothetical protein